MCRSARLQLAALLLLPLLAACARQQSAAPASVVGEADAPHPREWVWIEFNRPSYRLGEPIPVHVVAYNDFDVSVVIGVVPSAEWQLTLSKDGRDIDLIPPGAQTAFGPQGLTRVIPAHGRIEIGLLEDLRRRFRISEEGSYELAFTDGHPPCSIAHIQPATLEIRGRAEPMVDLAAPENPTVLPPVWVELTTPKTSYRLGEPIPVTITVRNDSGAPVPVHADRYLWCIELLDAAGRMQPDIAEGYQTANFLGRAGNAIPPHSAKVVCRCDDLRCERLVVTPGRYFLGVPAIQDDWPDEESHHPPPLVVGLNPQVNWVAADHIDLPPARPVAITIEGGEPAPIDLAISRLLPRIPRSWMLCRGVDAGARWSFSVGPRDLGSHRLEVLHSPAANGDSWVVIAEDASGTTWALPPADLARVWPTWRDDLAQAVTR